MPMKACCPPQFFHNGFFTRTGEQLAAPLLAEEEAALGLEASMLFPAPFFVAGRVTSTFDLAWELCTTHNLPPWSAVLAVCQTSGRGQMRREWFSPPGNLYVSLFLPQEMARLQNLLSLATGALACEALCGMGIPVSLKWPNDILLSGPAGGEGKFGGILLEERAGRIVAGLGVNLRTAPPSTALRQAHAVPAAALPGVTDCVGVFWRRMASAMREAYARHVADVCPEEIRKRTESILAWRGKRVYSQDLGVSGELLGIASDASLILRTANGRVAVGSGSVFLE